MQKGSSVRCEEAGKVGKMGTDPNPVRWMEALCNEFQSNPKRVEHELMALRTSAEGLDIARAVLQGSSMADAHFHALCTLQAALIARWDDLSEADRKGARDFLWDWLLSRQYSVPRNVVAQALKVLAVLWKLAWASLPRQERQAFLAQVSQLARGGANDVSRLLATRALMALVSEFGASPTSVGLPLEFHKKAHAAFAECGLLETLALAMEVLAGAVQRLDVAGDGVGEQELNIAAVELCTEVLHWKVKDLEVWQIPPSHELVTLSAQWRPYVLQHEFLNAVFRLYEVTRGALFSQYTNPGPTVNRGGSILAHGIRQLICLLASIKGDVFVDMQQRGEYAAFMVERVSSTLLQYSAGPGASSSDLDESLGGERFDSTLITVRLIVNFGVAQLSKTPAFSIMLERLCQMTTDVLECATKCAADEDIDQSWHLEVFDSLLEGWALLVQDVQEARDSGVHLPAETAALRDGLTAMAYPLYEAYVRHKLQVARCEAAQVVEEEEENEEIVAWDSEEQMNSMALLGRMSVARTATALDALLHSVDERLRYMYTALVAEGKPALVGGNSADPSSGTELSPSACSLLEEAVMAIQLAGHLLADSDTGETPVIPQEIQEVISTDDSACSSVISLTSTLISLLAYQTSILSAAGEQASDSPLCSPHLSHALLLTLARCARVYVCPDPSLYTSFALPPSLGSAFGCAWDTFITPPNGNAQTAGIRGGAAVIDAMLEGIWSTLTFMPSEISACEAALELLKALAVPSVARGAVSRPVWGLMVQAMGHYGHKGHWHMTHSLQSKLIRHLLTGLLSACPDGGEGSAMEAIARPVVSRLHTVVQTVMHSSPEQRQSPSTISASLLCVSLWRGIVTSGGNSGGGKYQVLIGEWLEGSLEGIVALLRVYIGASEEIVGEILALLLDAAELLLLHMPQGRAAAFYSVCGTAISLYSDHHRGLREADPTAEDAAHADITYILRLLTHLVDKDLVDFDTEGGVPGAPQVPVADVAFFGLGKVLPLMTQSLFQFEDLAGEYFSFVSFMVETYAQRLVLLEPYLFSQIVNSLLHGSAQGSAATARTSLRAIGALVTWHNTEARDGGLNSQLAVNPNLLKDILQALLELAAFLPSVWDRLDACGEAMLPFAVFDANAFQALAAELSSQKGAAVQHRLMSAFHQLLIGEMGSPPLAMNRDSRHRFNERLRQFATSVRSFMQYR